MLGKEARDGTWALRHRQGNQFSLHNHEPSLHTSAHPAHRQLSLAQEISIPQGEAIGSLSNAGIAPKEIQTYLRQTSSGTLATRQDIYNTIAAVRRDACEGQSPIQALADQLFKEGFWSQFQTSPDGRVIAVFFAHPDSLAYLRAYPNTLLLDCTYKTNKYNMPLLDMVGVDASQRSFCIAFAFLSGEGEDNFAWALDRLKSLYEQCNTPFPSVVLVDHCPACINALDTYFPTSVSLLCIWHVNKAVLAHCQPSFKGNDDAWADFYESWHWIVDSPTEEVFKERHSKFEKKYIEDHLNDLGYLRSTWLIPYKEKIIKAWTNQHMHFGNAATSRAEG